MATDIDFVKFVADQIDEACRISYRKMFGEYALYSKGKVVALACDDQLFVKADRRGKVVHRSMSSRRHHIPERNRLS